MHFTEPMLWSTTLICSFSNSVTLPGPLLGAADQPNLRHQPAHQHTYHGAKEHFGNPMQPAFSPTRLDALARLAAMTMAAVIGACRHIVLTRTR